MGRKEKKKGITSKPLPRVRGRNSIQEWNMILPDTFSSAKFPKTYFSLPRNSSSVMESGAGSHVLLFHPLFLEIAWICKCTRRGRFLLIRFAYSTLKIRFPGSCANLVSFVLFRGSCAFLAALPPR